MARRILFALALVFVALTASPAHAADQPFIVGWDQAWFHGDYGSDLTTKWDPTGADALFAKIQSSGGQVVRFWLFEGEEKEGLVFTQSTRTAGLAPGFLDHVTALCAIARAHGLLIYFTLFDGNYPWAGGTHAAYVHYNILNNKYGEADAFNQNALAPLLDTLSKNQDAVFAIDIMNEVEGSLAKWFWPDAWSGARPFLKAEAAFIHQRAPWAKVTASAGWGTAADDLTSGLFEHLGFDFFDLHLYNDTGSIPDGFALRLLHWRSVRPLILGEFGQATVKVDDALQRSVTQNFVRNAKSLGFSAALGWRFDDQRPWDPSFVPNLTWVLNGQVRPAAADLRAAAVAAPKGVKSIFP